METVPDELIIESIVPYLSTKDQIRFARSNPHLYRICLDGYEWTRVELSYGKPRWRPPPIEPKLGQFSAFLTRIKTQKLTSLQLDVTAAALPRNCHVLTLPNTFPVLVAVKELKLVIGSSGYSNSVSEPDTTVLYQKMPNLETYFLEIHSPNGYDWFTFPWPMLKNLTIFGSLPFDARYDTAKREGFDSMKAVGQRLRKIESEPSLCHHDQWVDMLTQCSASLEILKIDQGLWLLDLAQMICPNISQYHISFVMMEYEAHCGRMFEIFAKMPNLRVVSMFAWVQRHTVKDDPMNSGPNVPRSEFDLKPEKICHGVTELRYDGLGWDLLPLILPFFPNIEILDWTFGSKEFVQLIHFEQQLTSQKLFECLSGALRTIERLGLTKLRTLKLCNLMLPAKYFEKLVFPTLEQFQLINMHDNTNKNLTMATLNPAIARIPSLGGVLVTIDNRDGATAGHGAYFDRYMVPKRLRMTDFFKRS